ncbi:MAG: hypothetical protein CBB76_10820 [Crocinitomicaceae bacterium TMED16]|nr:MAG: hypothetical protein CBB76_10820 [Crocinitomicaceae bacterium TMED16]
MKIVSILSVLILLCSCGKYERPFITFKSPEERLMGTEWRCVEAVKENGESTEIFDHIIFEINNGDSTFRRITNYSTWTYSTSSENDTILGNWTWGYALEGNFNKQMIEYAPQNFSWGFRYLKIIRLSKNELVLQDKSHDNTTYHYAPL